jgi:hypothetical protein
MLLILQWIQSLHQPRGDSVRGCSPTDAVIATGAWS